MADTPRQQWDFARRAPAGARDRDGGHWFTGVVGAVFGVSVLVGGFALVRLTDEPVENVPVMRGQAEQLARIGLSASVHWLRRQPAQPVTSFSPGFVDSADPGIGLVGEVQLAEDVWGRFEVWKPDGTDNSVMRRRLQVEDLSSRSEDTPLGTVWSLRSNALVYRRSLTDVRFDPESAEVIERVALTALARRVSVRLPGQAALCVRDADGIVVRGSARIEGGARGAGVYSARGEPFADERTVFGVPASSSAAREELYDDSVSSVFGSSEESLAAMADAYVRDAAFFPVPLQPNSVTFVELDELNCTVARPLEGSGILYVKGNLTINPGSDSTFTGLIFVTGDLTVYSPAEFRGAVVVGGRVLLQSSGDRAALTYDEGVLDRLAQEVGAYRISTPILRVDGEEKDGD